MEKAQPNSGLLDVFIKGQPSEEQIEALKNMSDEELEQHLKKMWNQHTDPIPVFTQAERNQIFLQVTRKGNRGISALLFYAAASVALILFAYFWGYKKPLQTQEIQVSKPIDISPGGNKATLRLSSGQVIHLDELPEGLLSKEGTTKIIKTEGGKIIYQAPKIGEESLINTIETPRGGQYLLVLSDGTQVWLNAASSLTYPNSFGRHKPRKVMLQGEAFFRVTANKKQPFIVDYANGSKAEVIGTSFNINAYEEENAVFTTLTEGGIRVTMPDNREWNLLPGEQVGYVRGSSYIKRVDIEEITAWKAGWFIFNRLELEAILRQLSRWYQIDFVIKEDLGKKQFSGIVSRSNPISEVLKIMEGTGIKFTLKGTKIEVSL